MVLRSQRDSLGSSSQAPRDCTSGTRGDIDVPAVGQHSGAQGPDSKGRASRSGVWVCGATLTWLHGWAGGAREGIASSDRTLLPTGEERGDGNVETGSRALPSSPSWDPEKKETALMKFWVQNKNSPPGPLPGEGVVLSPSPEEQDPEAPGRPSQGRRLPWHFTGLAGAEAGCAAFLRPAPCCGRCEGCCCGRARAEVEAAGGRLRRRGGGRQRGGGGWRQQRTAGAGCDETPPSASVQRRTVGQVLHRFAE